MDGKIITMGNVSDYVKKREVKVNGGVWDGKKIPFIKMILACFFFSGSIVALSAMGYYLIETARVKNITSNYFELHDFFASIIHESFLFYIWIGIFFLAIFFIVLFSKFYTNKVLRAKRIIILLCFHMLVFILIFFFLSCFFIPKILGSSTRYFLIFLSFVSVIILSLYWSKKRINIFYKLSEHSKLYMLIHKIKVWIWPVLAIISAISFATAPGTRDARLAFYGAISPFMILLLFPFIYLVFYYGVGEFLELYYMNKYPEAIRMETNFTKEEWYGPKYQKSKEVMRKIKEFEDYINN